MAAKNPVLTGCGVLLFNDKKQFLMMKRNSEHATGTYAVPGGWMEFGESFEETAVREIQEELGVTISNIKVLGVVNTVFPKESKHSVAVILAAKLESGEPKVMEPHKCESLKWYDDWNKLPQPLMCDYHQYITSEHVDGYLRGLK